MSPVLQVSARGSPGQTHQAAGLSGDRHGDLDQRCRHDPAELCEDRAAGGPGDTSGSHPEALQQGSGPPPPPPNCYNTGLSSEPVIGL